MKNLYVDDIRTLPTKYNKDEWDIAKNYTQAIEMLTNNTYHTISLDHDIASFDKTGKEFTGYDIVKWLVQRHFDGEYVPCNYMVHSANPIGAERMLGTINRYLINK